MSHSVSDASGNERRRRRTRSWGRQRDGQCYRGRAGNNGHSFFNPTGVQGREYIATEVEGGGNMDRGRGIHGLRQRRGEARGGRGSGGRGRGNEVNHNEKSRTYTSGMDAVDRSGTPTFDSVENFCKSGIDPRHKTGANNYLEIPLRVDQNEVLRYLINSHDGSCLILDIQEGSDLFQRETSPNRIIQSMRNFRAVKVLENPEHIERSLVKVFIKSLRLCINYRHPKPCNKQNCNYLHMCRGFLMNCCFTKNCQLSHDIQNKNNPEILKECGVHIFSKEQQISLVRCSNLMICHAHNSPEKCPYASTCYKLHICNSYVLKKCLLPGTECSEGHDPFNQHNKNILRLYQMDKMEELLIFQMLLTFCNQTLSKVSPKTRGRFSGNTLTKKEEFPPEDDLKTVDHEVPLEASDVCDDKQLHLPITEPAVLDEQHSPSITEIVDNKRNLITFTEFVQRKFNSAPICDEEQQSICSSFEVHSCNVNEECTDRHKSRSPYLWMVKRDGQWIDLKVENTSIEKAFCNPNNDEYWDMSSFPDEALRLDFMLMTSDFGPVQRLSTPSYTKCHDQSDSTVWCWYWYDANTPKIWNEFGLNHEPPYQDILEGMYQQDRRLVCCYEIGHNMYELDFSSMQQTNLKTRVVRNVKRRPVYQEKSHWTTNKRSIVQHHCDVSKLPSGWTYMDTESRDGLEVVPLHSDGEDFRMVKDSFFATMDRTKYKIRRIYRVQNLELLTNYQQKKISIDKHNLSESEVNVFHGTAEEETTRWICGVGFDQRMHGVNGTVYGKGAYFAFNASYSHNYTQPSNRNLRYMFYATVTLGKYTRGKSEYKRPPPIDPKNPKKGLYDSCVDDVSKPSIYVIFENSQTFPKYLIEYQDLPVASAGLYSGGSTWSNSSGHPSTSSATGNIVTANPPSVGGASAYAYVGTNIPQPSVQPSANANYIRPTVHTRPSTSAAGTASVPSPNLPTNQGSHSAHVTTPSGPSTSVPPTASVAPRNPPPSAARQPDQPRCLIM